MFPDKSGRPASVHNYFPLFFFIKGIFRFENILPRKNKTLIKNMPNSEPTDTIYYKSKQSAVFDTLKTPSLLITIGFKRNNCIKPRSLPPTLRANRTPRSRQLKGNFVGYNFLTVCETNRCLRLNRNVFLWWRNAGKIVRRNRSSLSNLWLKTLVLKILIQQLSKNLLIPLKNMPKTFNLFLTIFRGNMWEYERILGIFQWD